MEEIRIYSSIWRKEFFVGVLCVALAVMLLIYDISRLPVILFLGLMGVFILFTVFRERLTHRPYLTITDESIIIRKRGEVTTIRFDEIKSFERETLTILKHTTYTGMIIVHLVSGHGFVHVISADRLSIKQQVLCDLLNERLNKYRANFINPKP